MRPTRLTLFIALLLAALPLAAQKSDAVTTVRKAVDRILAAPSATISFTATQGANSESGTITIMRDAFRISSPSFTSWFDGKTQWTLLPDTGEVNMSTPTPSEIAESNPFSILSTLSSLYSLSPAPAPSGSSAASLRPRRSSAPFSSATVTVSNSSLLPTLISATPADGSQPIKITVKSVSFGKKLPLSSFRFNQRDFPDVEIIDLR